MNHLFRQIDAGSSRLPGWFGVLLLALLSSFLLSPAQAPAQSFPFTLDFEEGTLRGWEASGTAFAGQPAHEETRISRERDQPSGHQGKYWISTFLEPTSARTMAARLPVGDQPTGILTSGSFTIPPGRLTFLVGGGSSPQTRVELWAGPGSDIEFMEVARSASGRDSESMVRVSWDLSDVAGKTGKIRIVDGSAGPGGHINVDDFRFENPPAVASPRLLTVRPEALVLAVQIPVPQVVGLQLPDAQKKISGAKLNVGRVTDVFSQGRPGTVLRQSPTGDARVNAGTAVDLWVARGVSVPDVVGKHVEEALPTLEKAELKPGQETVVPSGRPRGTVLEQKPGPKTIVPPGTVVDLAIAGGRVVPDVVGKPVADARAILTKAGLKPGREEEKPSRRPQGTVLDQKPRAWDAVPDGAPVDLLVAVPDLVVVPRLVGRSLADAKIILAKLSLQTGRVTERPNPGPPETVLEQNPPEGAEVTTGSMVDLVAAVSLPTPEGVEVPPLEGRTLDEAERILGRVRLLVGEVEERPGDAEPGTVTAQNPDPGGRVEAGSRVDLVVAIETPAPMVGVPDVTGLSLERARRILGEVGLVSRDDGTRPSEREEGTVLEQRPGPGSPAPPGTVVRLVTAEKKKPPPWIWMAAGIAIGGVGVLLLRGGRKSGGEGQGSPRMKIVQHGDKGVQRAGGEALDWEIALRPRPDPGEQTVEVDGSLIADQGGKND